MSYKHYRSCVRRAFKWQRLAKTNEFARLNLVESAKECAGFCKDQARGSLAVRRQLSRWYVCLRISA